MSIQVKEVAFIYHAVADIPRARAFYGKLLGLKIGMEIEFSPGTWWIEYDIAGVCLAISNAMPEAPGGNLALEVADLEATLADIKAAGVTVTLEIQDFTPCNMFVAKSPDGYSITFHKRKYKA